MIRSSSDKSSTTYILSDVIHISLVLYQIDGHNGISTDDHPLDMIYGCTSHN